MKAHIKAIIITAIIVILCIILTFAFIEKIPRGYVGAVYSMKGGTADYTLAEGWHVVSPTKKITKYSVATEQLLLTAEEGESFTATCSDGVLDVDLEMSYHFDSEDVPEVAKRYRGLSGEAVVDTRIKSKVKTYVNEITAEYSILEAYMDKKSELNTRVTQHLQEKLTEYGLVVESATIPRATPNEEIAAAITERSKKAQETEAAKQEQEKQKILAETKLIEAQGEANAAIEKARGEAESNAIISASLTPNLLTKMEMEARMQHGWVTIQGANTVVTEDAE